MYDFKVCLCACNILARVLARGAKKDELRVLKLSAGKALEMKEERLVGKDNEKLSTILHGRVREGFCGF